MHYKSALEVAQLVHNQEISSVELTENMLQRIEAQKHLKAFVTVTAEHALMQAESADKDIASGNIRSRLHGVPIALKDLLATKGITTTNGMPLYSNNVPDHDATVVARLNDAGTVCLGKLKLTEGAYARHHSKVEVPINAYDENCWVGVSSSGSGVATSAGLCFASLGTDTGGSIRFPSAANGIVGLKPTWGRVSRHGAFPLAYTLDHIGPMTRSVSDAAAMLTIIAGRDENDPTSSSMDVTDFNATLDDEVKGLKIGIDRRYIEQDVDGQLIQACDEVMGALQSLGCELVDIEIAYAEIASQWPITTAVEALHAHKQTYPSQKDAYGPIGALLELALTLPAEAYMQAEIARRSFKAHLNSLFASCDVLLCPSMPYYASSREGSPEMDAAENDLANTLKFTAPFNFSGSPTLSLPWTPGSKKIPTGVQLVGRDFEEACLLRLGRQLEKIRGELAHPD